MPQPSEASALLAFTGDTQFNVDCRNRAKRRGMHLNEFGLWRPKLSDVETDSNGRGDDWDASQGQECGKDSEDDQWELVKTPDEAALLRELGMGYIVPERRNLANIYPREKASRAEATTLRRSHRDQSSQLLVTSRTQKATSRPPWNSDSSKFLSTDRERSQLQKSSTQHPRSSQTRPSR
jgi:DNA polymerase beta thumb